MNSTTLKRLFDARTAAKLTGNFIAGLTLEIYLSQVQLRSAVERQLQIVGEALNAGRAEDPRVVDEIPDVHRYVALRNVIVHAYGSLDDDFDLDERVLWATLTEDIPPTINVLTSLVSLSSDELERRFGG